MEYQEWSTQDSVITYMEKDTKIKIYICVGVNEQDSAHLEQTTF